jgi:ABC-2 type transport system permease protein
MKYLHSRNRAILREMISTDFKIRYQGSVLGYFWSLLKPLLLFAILYVIFTYIVPVGKDIEHYPVILLLGVVLWSFFSEVTSVGAGSVVANGDLIRKISIPRYLVVLASSFSALINLGLSLIVVFAFSLFNGLYPQVSWFYMIVPILELFIFSVGIAFILATANVKYRDVTYIWEVFLQGGFYASAIIFPIMLVPADLRVWFFLNPVVQMIQDARYALVPVNGNVTIWQLDERFYMKLIPFVIVVAVCIIGAVYFKRRSKYFAEDI